MNDLRLFINGPPTTSGPSTKAGGSTAVLGTILSVWAHPDDETYLAAGVMAAATDNGQRVVCVSASAGEHGTSDPEAWPPARLGRVRRWEAGAAMAVLGVTEHGILGLPDGELAHHDGRGLAMIGRLLDEVRPDTILTFGPEGNTYHPDHIAVHRWVTEAWEARGRPSRLLYSTPTGEHLARFRDVYESWGMYMSDERPAGVPEAELTIHVRLDGPALDRKLAALHAMATQTRDLLAAVDHAVYASQVAEEAFIDSRVLARHLHPARSASGRSPDPTGQQHHRSRQRSGSVRGAT